MVVRTDNGPQFISMAFETACERLSVELGDSQR
ncbi:MAG: transposase family protein [Tissierellia bacterium]|nr:transposase family protein [Tissierellia bacterium]